MFLYQPSKMNWEIFIDFYYHERHLEMVRNVEYILLDYTNFLDDVKGESSCKVGVDYRLRTEVLHCHELRFIVYS